MQHTRRTPILNVNAGGIYLCYPFRDALIHSRHGHEVHKVAINNQHTKIGECIRFAAREKSYQKTLGGVVFLPLLILREKNEREQMEAEIRTQLLTEFSMVPTKMDWFDTTERDRMIDIMISCGDRDNL